MEGRKMDPKLAKILAEHAVPNKKPPAEEIAANDPLSQDVPITTQAPDLFERMYPLLAKKLRRRKGGAGQR